MEFRFLSKSGNKIATFYYQSLLKDLTETNHSKPIQEKSTHILRRYNSYSNLKASSNLFYDKPSENMTGKHKKKKKKKLI